MRRRELARSQDHADRGVGKLLSEEMSLSASDKDDSDSGRVVELGIGLELEKRRDLGESSADQSEAIEEEILGVSYLPGRRYRPER